MKRIWILVMLLALIGCKKEIIEPIVFEQYNDFTTVVQENYNPEDGFYAYDLKLNKGVLTFSSIQWTDLNDSITTFGVYAYLEELDEYNKWLVIQERAVYEGVFNPTKGLGQYSVKFGYVTPKPGKIYRARLLFAIN
jgi:hypothetical protein